MPVYIAAGCTVSIAFPRAARVEEHDLLDGRSYVLAKDIRQYGVLDTAGDFTTG